MPVGDPPYYQNVPGILKENRLPTRWELALGEFERAQVLPKYLGEHYCRTFARCRRTEAERYHNEISNRDYEWYLRAV